MRLEWLYRMTIEPQRLWKRYVIGIPVFLRFILWRKFAGPQIVRSEPVRSEPVRRLTSL